MNEKKIVVPDGMVEAAKDYLPITGEGTRRMLEAAMRWIVDQEPTDEQAELLLREAFGYGCNDWSIPAAYRARQFAKEGIKALLRRMFIAPEPKIPQEVRELQFTDLPDARGYSISQELANQRILEAYRLGQRSEE